MRKRQKIAYGTFQFRNDGAYFEFGPDWIGVYESAKQDAPLIASMRANQFKRMVKENAHRYMNPSQRNYCARQQRRKAA